ncbi:MAG: ABC transporter permease [Candidatus Sabulitectum sp.]|nr:ABC transporter permease [Candidatus Sabulitectum sp.]
MKTLSLFSAEGRMMYWSLRRYMFNTVAMVAVLFLIFMGMFWGVKTIGGSGVTGESLDSMLVGYILWVSAMLALGNTGGEILTESQRGTLEQLYLSPLGAHRIFFFRALVNILFNFIIMTIMLYLSMAATGRWLSVNLLYLYGMVFLSTLSLVGISFMMGGLGLIHKKISSINGILSFGLIGLMLLPTYPLTPYAFLPFIAGAAAVRNSIVQGASFPIWWYLFIAGNSIFYVALGLAVFKRMETKAKRLNKMNQY